MEMNIESQKPGLKEGTRKWRSFGRTRTIEFQIETWESEGGHIKPRQNFSALETAKNAVSRHIPPARDHNQADL